MPKLGEEASVHLSYEMVALSPAACDELGIALSDEDRKRPYIEMSGRKGLGVKADDLINRLEADALAEVMTRHPDLSDEEMRETAHAIAVGALRYFLLKFTRNSVIAFDFKEAISFEGETGPYCQYAAVRANSIFRKLDEQGYRTRSGPGSPGGEPAWSGGSDRVAPDARAQAERLIHEHTQDVTALLEGEVGSEIWALLMLAARLEEINAQAVSSTEPAFLAKYAFNLAKAFNLFYHRHRIIAEEDLTRRAVLITVADFTRRQLTAALKTLGIIVPERM